VVLQTTA